MILHVAHPDKFIPPFINLINNNFPNQTHYFWLDSRSEKYVVDEHPNVYNAENDSFGKWKARALLVYKMHEADKVILHGLFNDSLIKTLSLVPWLLPKCYWAIWGGDLYRGENSEKITERRSNELLRTFVIKRLGHLVTYIAGDVELARHKYGAKGKHHECLLYQSNTFAAPERGESQNKPEFSYINILLGNSADPSNNHIDALKKLLPYKAEPLRIYAPLSYGDAEHAEKVISVGKEWFGNKFIALTSFIQYEEYLDLLSTIDIAIFNHERQQAMGNTINLLGFGKTVFINSDVSQARFLHELGITFCDASTFSLRTLPEIDLRKNKGIVNRYFSEANLINQLAEIFRS